MPKIYPVIMAGGAGTRLWPLSRKLKPKQFQPVVTENSMFVETVARLSQAGDGVEVADPTIICSALHRQSVEEQCATHNIAIEALVLEPVGRNTAPVAALSSLLIQERDPDGVILLLPADHVIPDVSGFWDAVRAGLAAAEKSYLTTFGIQPTHPETGYGYIKTAGSLGNNLFKIERFEEKPGLETAERYLKAGVYYWNAGIFLFQARAMIQEFSTAAADILASCETCLAASARKDNTIELDHTHFSDCRAESIDYAVMEHTKKGAIVAPVSIGWNDIGAWSAVSEMVRDSSSGASATFGNVIELGTQNSLIRSDGPLVAAIGVENLVIVATDDAILVTTAERAQDVKSIVNQLADSGKDELL